MQGFPTAVVVAAGPRRHGPTVIELPDNTAHAVRTVAAEGFHAHLDGIGLQHLTYIKEVLESLFFSFWRIIPWRWHTVVATHVFLDTMVGISACVLVGHHHFGVDVVVARVGVVAEHALVLGEGLETVFTLEADMVVEISFDGVAAVPDAPVVVVAIDAVGGGVLERPGAGGTIGRAAGIVADDFG